MNNEVKKSVKSDYEYLADEYADNAYELWGHSKQSNAFVEINKYLASIGLNDEQILCVNNLITKIDDVCYDIGYNQGKEW